MNKSQKLFENGNDEYISILVGDYGGFVVDDSILESLGGEKTTINNITGYMGENSDVSFFNYQIDGKLVTVTGFSDEIINDFLMAQ